MLPYVMQAFPLPTGAAHEPSETSVNGDPQPGESVIQR